MIQNRLKIRALSLCSTVHRVFSPQIRKLVNRNVIFVFFRVCTFLSALTPALPNPNVLPSNATVHLSDPSMLTETPWQYYHVNEARLILSTFGRALVYRKHACQSSSVLSSHTIARRACVKSYSQPKGQHQY